MRKWSPEQIAIQLRRDHRDDPRWWVSAEAIYHSLYVQGRGGLKAELTQHLRHQRRARKQGSGPGRLVDMVHISRLPGDRTAPTVRDALAKVIATIPAQLRRSLTWDNGKEMAEHRAVTLASNLQVYFCDPGHPWQRGTAENTIGLLRAYLPKGQDLSTYTPRHIASFAVMLNERPRHTLGWRSPAQAYAELLAVQ